MELSIESLRNTLFSRQDVIVDKNEAAKRRYNLNRALALGHLYKRKVIIYFRTLEGALRKIEARVWAHGEEYISVKGGNHIPIRSIENVEF